MDFLKNNIVDYYDDRRISTGVILEADSRRLRILNHQGKETKISPSRVLISASDPDFPVSGPKDDQVSRLKEVFLQRDEIKRGLNLQEIWEVVVPEARQISIEDLSELAFGNDRDFNCSAALLRAIFEDKIFFKIRPDRIDVPPRDRVEQALAQREKERKRLEFVSACADFLARLKDGDQVRASSAPEEFIPMLEEAAYLGRDWTAVKTVQRIFSRAGIAHKWDPFQVLVKLDVWSEDENLRLRSEKAPVRFSAAADANADKAAKRSFPPNTEDLSDREMIAVDSVATRDVDDALSLWHEGDEIILGIHITDVAHFLDHDAPLDLEVRQRATSIYLPETMIPMIPRVLSEEAASLSVGAVQPGISLLVKIGLDLKPVDFRICSSLVRVTERISYEQADERTGDPDSCLAEMFTIAQALRAERTRSGAIIFKDPELSVIVEANGEIQVSRRDRETPSQVLVSEMMILANSLFARFLSDRKVPAPFRSQPPPSERIEMGDEHDPVASYLSKKSLVRGEVLTEPGRHSTLGLDCYTTATSPLRRYPDILVQRQIKSVLEEKPFLKSDELESILTVISYPLDRARVMERERQRYFLLKYLRERRNEEFEAVILQRFPRFHLVRIEEFCINAPMHVSNALSLNPYDRAMVTIDKINPREDKFSVSLVKLV